MVGIATHLLVATSLLLFCLLLVASSTQTSTDDKDLSNVTTSSSTLSKEDAIRKHKKFDPTSVVAAASLDKLKVKSRAPRQVGTEQRQYYPCTTCFKLGNREVCTNPYCPSEDYECDKSSKRCHKKAKVRGRESTPAQEAPAAEGN